MNGASLGERRLQAKTFIFFSSLVAGIILASCAAVPQVERRAADLYAQMQSAGLNNQVVLIASSDQGLIAVEGQDSLDVARQLAQSQYSAEANLDECFIFTAGQPDRSPVREDCHRTIQFGQLSQENARLGGAITASNARFNELQQALLASFEIGLINNDELVEVHKELHELGTLVNALSRSSAELQGSHAQILSELDESFRRLERLIRAGVPQYE